MSVGDVATKEEFDAVVAEKNYGEILAFADLFIFLDYCYRNRLTPDNSVTYWSERSQKMFLATSY